MSMFFPDPRTPAEKIADSQRWLGFIARYHGVTSKEYREAEAEHNALVDRLNKGQLPLKGAA